MMLNFLSIIGSQSVRATVATIAALVALWGTSHAQYPEEGGIPGALARENLARERPTAPVDLTGTYNFKVIGADADGHKFMPLPELMPAAQAFFDKKEAYRARGFDYLDNASTCWPYGVPAIMTRYWPVQFVQLPTVVIVISMVTSNVRWIYTDGRQHPAAEDLILTYNGHSIGHWEGETLVVDTVGFTDERHFVSEGVPAGTKLHVVERMSLSEDGDTLSIEFAMTDPDNWVGEWKNTKYYSREENLDPQEHFCIYEHEMKLPGFEKNLSE